jgi:arylsulfatase
MIARAILAVMLVAVFAGPGRGQPASSRPNVILILVDDMGYSDLGCYGSTIHTPNIDALARRGVIFRQAYNSAKCEPTRSSLMAGQWWQDVDYGVKRGPTLGQVMKAAGYRTLAVGKWHLDGNPVDRGFDRYFGHLSGACNYFHGDSSFRLDREKFSVPRDGSFYTTDAFADHAIRFIDQSLDEHADQPFFMYLAFNAPHSPLQAQPEDIARSKGKFDAGWDVLRAQRIEALRRNGLLDTRWAVADRPNTLPAWNSLSADNKAFEARRMEVYAAMIDRVDQAVGRLTKRLEHRGIDENTMIVFLSDNGANPFDVFRQGEIGTASSKWYHGLGWAWLANTPGRFYKRNMHMGGAITSMIVSWPGAVVQPGTITDEPTHVVDLMPTFLDVAGEPDSYPAEWAGQVMPPLPGRSIVPILKDQRPDERGALYFQLYDHRAVIADGSKLVSDCGGPWELYDLATDRFETHDLSATLPQQAAALAKQWDDWASRRSIDLTPNGGEPGYRALKPPKTPY